MSDLKQKNQMVPDWLELVQKHVASIRFGSIQLTVIDSKVVLVETTEKLRFEKPAQKRRP